METTIKVQSLSKSYGPMTAVNNVDITICQGEIFGLLGPNGAGKSTAIECILGTKTPDSGKVSILGMDPVKERKKLFERVGIQFQETSYQDKIRVSELCKVTAALYKTSLDDSGLLKQFGLTEKQHHYVSELSGGQKQKLFIVLALIPDPEVIFLDGTQGGLEKSFFLKGEGTDHFIDLSLYG